MAMSHPPLRPALPAGRIFQHLNHPHRNLSCNFQVCRCHRRGLCAAPRRPGRTLDAKSRKDGKIIDWPPRASSPFNYFEGTKLTGFEVEVAELVVKKMGLKLEWKTLGFDALLTGLARTAGTP